MFDAGVARGREAVGRRHVGGATPVGLVANQTIAMKRSALQRRTPLNRGTSRLKRSALKPGKPLRKVSERQRARLDVWGEVAARAVARVKGVCPVAGPHCQTKAVVGHHIRLRSQGGTDTDENCLPCCRRCHRFLHSNPAWSEANGFIRTKRSEVAA